MLAKEKLLSCVPHFQNGTLQNACTTTPRVVVGMGKIARSHTVRLMNSRRQGLKRIMTKVLWLCWKREIGKKENLSPMDVPIERGNPWKEVIRNWENSSERRFSDARQFGCVFQERRRSLFSGRALTCRSRSNVWSSQRLLRVIPKFETKIPRSVTFVQVHLMSVAPTLRNLRIVHKKRQSGRSKVPAKQRWKLAKSVLQLKEHQRATFFSSPENRCLPASTSKPEEREFVVDSGASMHMISKKDLSNAEMDTLTKSCSPTIVITANGEVQTHEEAIVYVKELDIFLTMKVLNNTPAVLSLGKLIDENGYSYEWINGQKPLLINDGIRIVCNTENFVTIVVPGLSISSSGSSSTSRTPMKQESHSSSSSSSSFSPTVGEMPVQEREDAPDSTSLQCQCLSWLMIERRNLWKTKPTKLQKPKKKRDTTARGDPLCSDDSEIPEWLQEFRENLVDDEIPLQGGSHASSSHEASLEPTTKRREVLGKHNVHTHFP